MFFGANNCLLKKHGYKKSALKAQTDLTPCLSNLVIFLSKICIYFCVAFSHILLHVPLNNSTEIEAVLFALVKSNVNIKKIVIFLTIYVDLAIF